MGLFGNKGNKLLKKYEEANARGMIDKAADLLRQAAEAKSGKAMLMLGRSYLYGFKRLHIEQDYHKAVEWLIKAAEDNTVYMGDDLEYAWQKAGRAGNPPVKSTVPRPADAVSESDEENYLESVEARKNRNDFRMMESLKFSARYRYNGLARNDLAWEYTRRHEYRSIGKVDEIDINKAFEWFQRAINVGYLKAYCSWGDYYTKSGESEKAFEMYAKGAEAGDECSMCCLATAYMEGNGCKKDDDKALYWFRKAEEKGYADAANGIGLLYEKGRAGLPKQDEKTAFSWYKKAASMESPSGMYNVGRFYYTGKAAPKDKSAALSYFFQVGEAAKKKNVALANDMDEVLARDKNAAFGMALYYADFWKTEHNAYCEVYFCEWLAKACKYGINIDFIEATLEKYLDMQDTKTRRTKTSGCEITCLEQIADMGSKAANEFLFHYYSNFEWGTQKAHTYGLQTYRVGGFIEPADFLAVRDRLLREAEKQLDEDIEEFQSGKTDRFLSTAQFRYEQLANAENDAYIYYKLGMIRGLEGYNDEAKEWFDKALSCPNLAKYGKETPTLEQIIKNSIKMIDEGGFFE